MTRTRRNCPVCGARDADHLHLARCAYLDELLAALNAYAATLDNPPKPVDVVDLVAHLGGYDDPERAHAAARVVLNLGWRKVLP